jgi:four helix bundle protein
MGTAPKENTVVQLSFEFAVKLTRAVGQMPKTTAGFELGRQRIRAGTSIGANIEEAQGAGTKPECIHSMNIAKWEARETRYWLRTAAGAELIQHVEAKSLIEDVERLIRILTAIVRTSEGRRRVASIIHHQSSIFSCACIRFS